MRNYLLFGCSAILFVCLPFFVQAQNFTNKGRDFWITFPAHVDGAGAVMGIYITSDQASSGTVQVGNGGPTIPFSITANNVRRIFLGNTAANDAPNGLVYQDQLEGVKPGSAIHVTSDQPIVVYAHIIRQARSGSSLVIPSPTWGREYIIPSYSSTGSSGAASGRGVITVVSKEPNTVVEIIPTANSFDGSRVAGVPYSITLPNQGDVYQVQFRKDEDISGTIVRSVASGTSACQPIGVFSASTWSAFGCPGATGGDNLFQQLFPTRSFGRTYVTAPFIQRQTDIIRVFTIEANTVISKTENGNTVNLAVSPNGFAEFQTSNPTQISANKPILVVQYMNSQSCDSRNPAGCLNNGTCPFPADPEMVILSSVEQTLNNITVFSAHRNFVPSGQSNVNQCFLNIVIPTTAAASVRINGAPPAGTFQVIPGTTFSYLQENVTNIAVTNPVQQVQADSSFSCIAYGYGNVESYGYNAGTNVRDLFQFMTVRDPYRSVDAASVCQNTPFDWFITIPYPASKLEWIFGGSIPPVVMDNPVPDSTYQKEGTTLYRFKLPNEFTYSVSGETKVSIIATNPTSDGCSGEQQIDFDVVVFPQPTNTFNITHSGCLSDSVLFTSTGTVGGGNTIGSGSWFFGDGNSAVGNNTTHKYAQSGTFQVKHLVFSNNGCPSDTGRNNVVINPTPIAAFNIAGPYCQSRELTISNTSSTPSGTLNNWYWDMGNGTVFNQNTGNAFNYSYPDTGTFTIKHVVRSSTGCLSDTTIQTISVGSVPVPAFELPDVCLNDAFAEFENTSTIADGSFAQTTWVWNFGNSTANAANPNTSTLVNGRHRYTAAQIYTVKLVATSNAGCIDSLTQNFTVNGDQPSANFDLITQGNLCSNLPIQIQNKSTVNFGNVTQVVVYWDWGVNNSDSTLVESPNFDDIYDKTYATFSSPASRQVQIRLRAFSGTVCFNDNLQTLTLNATPDARIDSIPGICLDAAPITLNQGFDAGNNNGNGTYSGTGINATGLFTPAQAGAGTFTIQYSYLTTAGCTDTTTQNITVWPRPTAAFEVGTQTCIATPITLTNQSVANANTITTWNWNYGDGNTEQRNNGNPFTRTYETQQNFTVTLQVITDSGCTSTTTQRVITIHPKPQVDFDLPSVVCLPLGTGTFTNRTTVGGTGGTPITYQWQSGVPDLGSTQLNPTFRYTAVGNYNVNLTATSARGCIDSATKPFSNIVPQALANFVALPQEVCLGTNIQLEDRSNPLANTITAWQWNFGDGTLATTQNPDKLYASAGTYTISLYYTTNTGCNSDTLSREVVVHPFPIVNAGPDRFLLQGGETTLEATVSGSSDYNYLWTPNTWLINNTVLQAVSRAQDDITYRLTVTGAGGCSASDEVFVRLLLQPVIPNAFSPNGDGINDTWIIRHLDTYPGATVQVFDRYGRIVFSSTGYNNPWDGTIGNKPVPAGVYYYIVDPKNNLNPYTGSVTVLR